MLLAILTGPFGIAVGVIVKNWEKIKNGATKAKDWVVGKFTALVGFVQGLPGRISRAASGLWNGISDGARGAINMVIDAWNGLDFGIRVNVGPLKINIGDFIPDIPRLARGGLVRNRPGGTLALIGEGGEDELVVPLSRLGHVVPAPSGALTRARAGDAGHQGRRYEFHFHGSVRDPEETSRQFASRLRAWEVLNSVR